MILSPFSYLRSVSIQIKTKFCFLSWESSLCFLVKVSILPILQASSKTSLYSTSNSFSLSTSSIENSTSLAQHSLLDGVKESSVSKKKKKRGHIGFLDHERQ